MKYDSRILYVTGIAWDCDDPDANLPRNVHIPEWELVAPGEKWEDMVGRNERIAEYLSSVYGYTVFGFCVD